MKNTVIFDLDGLLIDSEIISFRLYEELTGKYGRSMTLEEYATDYSGKTSLANMKLLLERYQLPITLEEGMTFVDEREKEYLKDGVALKPGIDIVLEAVGLASELQDADIVVTGEGCLDFQTAMGKVPVGVAKAAKQYGCKVIAFAGSVTEEAVKCNEKGINAFFSILPGVCSLDEAMDTETAQKNMRNAAEQVFRLILDLYEHKT